MSPWARNLTELWIREQRISGAAQRDFHQDIKEQIRMLGFARASFGLRICFGTSPVVLLSAIKDRVRI